MATAKKSAAKKAAPRKAVAKKTAAKTPAKKPARRYGSAASASVARELHAMHEGTLTIGTSDKKVTNPKQAIAIGLAEARRAGRKVPPPPEKS